MFPRLARQLYLKTYFYDPNRTRQKESNKNHNGVLRRYMSRKTDSVTILPAELEAIIDEINDRPGCLNYQTPSEVKLNELQCLKLPKCSDSFSLLNRKSQSTSPVSKYRKTPQVLYVSSQNNSPYTYKLTTGIKSGTKLL